MSIDLKVDNLMYQVKSSKQSRCMSNIMSDDGVKSRPRTRAFVTPRKKRDLSKEFMEYAYKKSGLPTMEISTSNEPKYEY